MIDGDYTERNDGILVNKMVFPQLSRQHSRAEFICQASNTNQALPPSAKVVLDLNCKLYLCIFCTYKSMVNRDSCQLFVKFDS